MAGADAGQEGVGGTLAALRSSACAAVLLLSFLASPLPVNLYAQESRRVVGGERQKRSVVGERKKTGLVPESLKRIASVPVEAMSMIWTGDSSGWQWSD